ncbi:hypothetical protein [Methylocaldum gracile]
MKTASKKAIGQTVTVKVSAIQELCDYALAFYERQRPRGGDLELAAYQDAMGHLHALQKLFIADTAIVERVNAYIDRLTRLFLGDYYPSALPPASSGPEALPPTVLESGAAQEAVS